LVLQTIRYAPARNKNSVLIVSAFFSLVSLLMALLLWGRSRLAVLILPFLETGLPDASSFH
jgi:hypothetical protein